MSTGLKAVSFIVNIVLFCTAALLSCDVWDTSKRSAFLVIAVAVRGVQQIGADGDDQVG
jgi:hypothetical protein